jgi:hypothetical protein
MHEGSLEMKCNPMVDIKTCIHTLSKRSFLASFKIKMQKKCVLSLDFKKINARNI